jgi:peroxiredoxin
MLSSFTKQQRRVCMMKPGTLAPKLNIHTTDKKEWSLHSTEPSKFSLIVFYRGLHCPICEKQLKSLSKLLSKFKKQGVDDIIAISGDTEEKALKAVEDWDLKDLRVGHSQSLKSMSEWGLFLSKSIKDVEPKYFGEPGLFLVDKDKKLFYCSTNSMPFARPSVEDLLGGLEHINDGYPRRGTISYSEIPNIEGSKPKDIVNWKSEMEMADNHVIVNPKKEKTTPALKE